MPGFVYWPVAQAADDGANCKPIHFTVQHPRGMRWGFQLTARVVSDESKEAGIFASIDNIVQVRCEDRNANRDDWTR